MGELIYARLPDEAGRYSAFLHDLKSYAIMVLFFLQINRLITASS